VVTPQEAIDFLNQAVKVEKPNEVIKPKKKG
jgi:hypothetical protein